MRDLARNPLQQRINSTVKFGSSHWIAVENGRQVAPILHVAGSEGHRELVEQNHQIGLVKIRLRELSQRLRVDVETLAGQPLPDLGGQMLLRRDSPRHHGNRNAPLCSLAPKKLTRDGTL